MMRKLALAAFMVVIVAGCATPQARDTHAGREIDRAIEGAQAAATRPTAPPAAVADALLPPLNGRLPDAPAAVEPRFDLNVENQAARPFFMGLVRGTRYNMVVHPEVTGQISLSLRNVTIPEVMEIVRDVYGYEYQQTTAGFMVLPAQVRTQVFEVNYLNVRRSGSSRTRVSSGQATDAPMPLVQQGLGGVGGLGAPARAGAQDQQNLSGSSVETESEADFWPLLQQTLESIVGTGAGRGVIINAQTGTVLVRAMPRELREVQQYLDTVQASAQRMVVLEAKVIEVELRDGFESGIDWTAIRFRQSRDADGNLVPRAAAVLQGRDLFEGAAQAGLGGTLGFAVAGRDFEMLIQLLETQGRTQVLSSPRVSAVNNQKSVIKVGSDEFFVTSIGAQTTIGTAAATASMVQLTPFFSGIALDVTPQISGQGEVILHIQPTVSEVRDQTKRLPVGSGQQPVEVPLAFSTVRQSDSIVRARSGQVIVIGGLMRTQSHDDTAGIPVAGRLPGIGGLFRNQRTREVKSELVILLRPIIVDDGTWAEQMREQDRRLQQLGGPGR